MLLIAKLGNESHTSSASRVYAQVNGEYLGYKQAKEKESLENDKHARWDRFEFDLPEGTIVKLTVRGQDGNRGANKYSKIAMYQLDSSAPVVEISEYSGPGGSGPWLKGRLVEMNATDGKTRVDTSDARF